MHLALDSRLFPLAFMACFQFSSYTLYVTMYERTGEIGTTLNMIFSGVLCLLLAALLRDVPTYGHESVSFTFVKIGAPVLIWALCSKFFYHYNCRAATQVVQKDKAIYGHLWGLVTLRAENDLKVLGQLVDTVQTEIDRNRHTSPPIQCWTPVVLIKY